MQAYHRWLFVLGLIFISFNILSCEEHHEAEPEANKSAKIEEISGTNLHRIILLPEAAKRIAIQMTPLQERTTKGVQRKVIPYSAVLYDENGMTWTYISVKPLIFMRAQINIDHIDGNFAILSSGPPRGSEVVTVGASELFGTEFLGSIQP